MKTIHLLLIFGFVALGIVRVPAPSIDLIGQPDIAIKGAGQELNYQEVSAKTNLVRGATNVVTVQESTATNITLNAESLLAMLANSFNTNFPTGTQLLIVGSRGIYSLTTSDATGTNLSVLPIATVMSSGSLSVIESGMQTELRTNQVLSSGNDTEAYTSALSIGYNDSAKTTGDGTHTFFRLICLVEAKRSSNLETLAGTESVNMTLSGGGQIRNLPGCVLTGTIKAKLVGRPPG